MVSSGLETVTSMLVYVPAGFEDDHSSSSVLSALMAGNMVSVRGLLFKTLSGNPVMVATKVRKR